MSVKKVIHYAALVVAGLIAAGLIMAVLDSGSPPPSPSRRSGSSGTERVSAVEAVLTLGLSPESGGARPARKEFIFGDKIYATVVIDRVDRGDHTITYHWINPKRDLQETYRKDFFSPGGRYRGWSWLELKGDDLLPFSVGPFGTGRFLGRWEVNIFLDGFFLIGKNFMVI